MQDKVYLVLDLGDEEYSIFNTAEKAWNYFLELYEDFCDCGVHEDAIIDTFEALKEFKEKKRYYYAPRSERRVIIVDEVKVE